MITQYSTIEMRYYMNENTIVCTQQGDYDYKCITHHLYIYAKSAGIANENKDDNKETWRRFINVAFNYNSFNVEVYDWLKWQKALSPFRGSRCVTEYSLSQGTEFIIIMIIIIVWMWIVETEGQRADCIRFSVYRMTHRLLLTFVYFYSYGHE